MTYRENGVIKMNESCEECKHYNKHYCNLMDDLVEPLDNCGMFDGDNK